jgi:DNA-binding MarR family transcriptional regulator
MSSNDPLIKALHESIRVIMRRFMPYIFHFAKGCGLSMPQIGVLFQLDHGGTSGISNLSDDLGITSAAGSQMLDRLVQQELILRSEDPVDRRVKKIVLTVKGRKILQEIAHMRQAWMEELAGALSPSEKEQVIAALNILVEKADQINPPAR